MSTAKHLAKRKPQAPALPLVVSLCLSVVFEVGTLYGAPGSTPLVLSDWNLRRMAFFFCLFTPLSYYARWKWREEGGWASLWGWFRKEGCIFATSVLAVCLASALAWLAMPRVIPASPRLLVALVVPLVTAVLLVVHRKRVLACFEMGYLVVAVSFGLLICMLMPPSASMSWDGAIHFDAAQAMSYVFDTQYTGADALMVQGGPDMRETYGVYAQMPIYPSTPQQGAAENTLPIPNVDDQAITRACDALIDAEENEAITVVPGGARRLDGVSCLAFVSLGRIPNAIGLWIGRLLHLAPPQRYFLARLADVLFYILCFYLGMRRLRGGKVILAAVSLVPLFLFIASSFSYDPWCTGLISYAIARFVGECQHRDRELSLSDVWGILVPFVLGCLVKAVLVPLALVFLFMPREKFAHRMRRSRYVALVLGAALLVALSFVAPFVFSVDTGTATGDLRGGSNVNEEGQVSFVLSNPTRYLGILLSFTAEFLSPTNLNHHLYYFAYVVPLNTLAGWVVSIGELLLLLLAMVVDRVDEPESGWSLSLTCRAFSLITIVLSYVLIASALYVSFTPVGDSTINGVQYRYLAPLYVPVMLLVGNGGFGLWKRVRTRRGFTFGFLLASCMLLTISTLDVFVLR